MRLTGCASWWLARTCSGGVTGLGHPLRARRYPGLEAAAAAHPRAGPGHRPGRAVLTKSVIYAPGAATIEPHGSSAGAMTRVWPGTSPAHPAAGSPSRTFEAPCARADRSRRRSCTPWTPSVAPSRPGIWTQPCACSPPTTTSPSRRPRRARRDGPGELRAFFAGLYARPVGFSWEWTHPSVAIVPHAQQDPRSRAAATPLGRPTGFLPHPVGRASEPAFCVVAIR